MSCVSGDWFGFGAHGFLFVVFRAFFVLGLLRVVARISRAGIGDGSLVVYLVSLTSRVTLNRSAWPFRSRFRVQSTIYFRSPPFTFATSEMATSTSTFNQEGEVSSVVVIGGTPLAAGDKGAAVEVAATDFRGFLKETAEVADQELQALLRKHDVDERLILEIGAQGVGTIADFVGLEGTEALVRDTLASSFGINESTVKGKVAIASYRASKYELVAPQCEVLVPLVELQVSEYHLLIDSLARSRGALLEDYDLPGRCYLEGFIKQVDGGLLLAERLSDIISKKEEDEQRAVLGFESAPSLRPYLTILCKAVDLTCTMPTCREELRGRYAIMGSAWEMIRPPVAVAAPPQRLHPGHF